MKRAFSEGLARGTKILPEIFGYYKCSAHVCDAEMEPGSAVWAWTGPDAAFERGKVDRIESHKGVVHVKLANGKMVEAREDTVHLANNANQDGVADNTELRQLNEATLLHNIRVRYAKDEGGCYTVTGHILIAVNPFKQLGIYDEKQVSAFPLPQTGRSRHLFETRHGQPLYHSQLSTLTTLLCRSSGT